MINLAYRIEYEESQCHNHTFHAFPRILMTGLCFVCFLAAVNFFWPEGREVLRLLLIPGSPDATLEAAETFVSELQCGSRLKSAATDFFRNMSGYEAFP